MDCNRDGSLGFRHARARAELGTFALLMRVAVATAVAGAVPAAVSAQQAAAATSLVFDGVTVVDVEHGKLVPAQRVVVTGNRIQAVGSSGAVKLPKGAQVVDARGKYLIPGLWDMEVWPEWFATDFVHPLLIANGVTGIRDAASWAPLDTTTQWRREILAGTRVGPPRQLLAGPNIWDISPGCKRIGDIHACLKGPADVVHLADSLKAKGADILTLALSSKATYFHMAAQARRLGMLVAGTAAEGAILEVSDSGTVIFESDREIAERCFTRISSASVERCQPVVDRFRRNGTWFMSKLLIHEWMDMGIGGMRAHTKWISTRTADHTKALWGGAPLPHGNWLRDSAAPAAAGAGSLSDSLGDMHLMQRLGMPIVAGTAARAWRMQTWSRAPGFTLHAELAGLVAAGLTPLTALQAATLNPAKMLRGTDSLGTVAAGKLADLVLLDADPLADITNTTTIRAVVANGRYYDRAALDGLLTDAQAKAKQAPKPIGMGRNYGGQWRRSNWSLPPGGANGDP